LPGYAELVTHNVEQPVRWNARVHLLTEQGEEYRKLEIRMPEEMKV
jgi:hypothetical protein